MTFQKKCCHEIKICEWVEVKPLPLFSGGLWVEEIFEDSKRPSSILWMLSSVALDSNDFRTSSWIPGKAGIPIFPTLLLTAASSSGSRTPEQEFHDIYKN